MIWKRELTLFFCVFVQLVYNTEWSDDSEQVEIIGNSAVEHIEVNSNFTLSCQGKKSLTWGIPEVKGDESSWTTVINETFRPNNHNFTYGSQLKLYNVTRSFEGTYYCYHGNIGDESDQIYLMIRGLVRINQVNKMNDTNYVVEGSTMILECQIETTRNVRFSWRDFDPSRMNISNQTKRDEARNILQTLTIHNVLAKDWCQMCTVTDIDDPQFHGVDLFCVSVFAKPKIEITKSNVFHLLGTPSTITCSVLARPAPEIEWQYKACQTTDCEYLPPTYTKMKQIGRYRYNSELAIINASESGYVKCIGRNIVGSTESIVSFLVTDVRDGFDIFGTDGTTAFEFDWKGRTEVAVARGDKISLTCGASIYNYSDISWMFDDIILSPGGYYNITKNCTKYSCQLKLEVLATHVILDSGFYACRVTQHDREYLYRQIHLRVKNPEPTVIYNTNLKDELEIVTTNELVLICEASGLPKPTVNWYKNILRIYGAVWVTSVKFSLTCKLALFWFKDGVLFNPQEPNRIQISRNKHKIVFNKTEEKDAGTYRCKATNKVNVVEKQQIVKFRRFPTWLIYVIIFVSSLFITTIVLFCNRLRKEKHLQRKLKELGLENFIKGAIENINPDLDIGDQAELLPYDQKWEFPIQDLKLGKVLGSGAFGIVMIGKAKNISKEKAVTTVAVKMVRRNADDMYIRALVSELKIMIHLGKHLNVVNLLGACTKNVIKRELLVIVEYCRFGNLRNYLLRHRDNYVNQVDPKTGKIDDSIEQEYFSPTCSTSSDTGTSIYPIPPPRKNVGYCDADVNSGRSTNTNSGMSANTNSGTSASTDMTTVALEGGVLLRNNSVQSETMSNYEGDHKANIELICTKDLLIWVFQVASGMEYLASRKVLHGDLAARNILLADYNVVKICDFGLAKSMYANDGYKKQGIGPLPVKWMAVESIRDGIFSTQSDVWSFGIVLWELFSLAATPYPGLDADEKLFEKLVFGYRMDPPEFAPREINKMMRDCWALVPTARPSFTMLKEKLETLLEDPVKAHYIHLNDPYLMMNIQKLEDGQKDYLAMLNPPTFEVLSSPLSVNKSVGQESLEDSGYIDLKPNTISNSGTDEGKFTSPVLATSNILNSEHENGIQLSDSTIYSTHL